MNAATFNVFLKMLSEELGPNDHAVLIMDQAGWHKARKLVVPENITVLYLPPHSPELNSRRAALGLPAEPLLGQPRVR